MGWLVGWRTNLPRGGWFLTIPASASGGGVLRRAVARGEDPLTDYTRIGWWSRASHVSVTTQLLQLGYQMAASTCTGGSFMAWQGLLFHVEEISYYFPSALPF